MISKLYARWHDWMIVRELHRQREAAADQPRREQIARQRAASHRYTR